MSNVLSQSQIDELLNSVREGDAAEKLEEDPAAKKVRKYDFYTPKKYTRDRLKLIYSIFENYSRVVASYLTSLLRMSVSIELLDMEEQKYYEFNNALGEHDLIGMVDFQLADSEDDDYIMMQISNQIMYSMIDRMLGGEGDSTDYGDSANNGFTDVELSLYEVILRHMLPIMQDAWQTYMELNLSFSRVESNPRLVQTIGSDEIVVIVIMSIEALGTTGQLNVCLPGRILDNVFKAFEKSMEAMNKRKDYQDEESPEKLLHSIRESTMEITAKLAEAQISMGDVYGMHVGDVINLRKPQDSEVYLYIEDKPWFRGKMGVQKGSMAVKINGTVNNQ